MDYIVFQWIHQWAGRYMWFDAIGIFFATWVTVGLIIVLGVLMGWSLFKNRSLGLAGMALLAGLLAKLFESVIAILIFFPRPFAMLGFDPLIAHNPLDSSFPSGHASFLFGIALYMMIAERMVSPKNKTAEALRAWFPHFLQKVGESKAEPLRPASTPDSPSLVVRGDTKSDAIIIFILAILVSLARVYVGVHWPLDIVGGVFTGLLAACVVILWRRVHV
jgi:undecaprenyl-diphosphatase